MSENITTSFYKSEIFKNIVKDFYSKDSEIRKYSFNLYCEYYHKPKIIQEIENITKSENPFETFILEEYEKFLSPQKISKITIFCIKSNKLDFFTYLVENYPLEVVIDSDFNYEIKYRTSNIYFKIRPQNLKEIDNIDFIKVIQKFHPNFFENYVGDLRSYFVDNFFYENRCDIVEYLLDEFKFLEEELRKGLPYSMSYMQFTPKMLDCFQILIRKYPYFFDDFYEGTIRVISLDILKIFRLMGLLRKVNFSKSFYHITMQSPDIKQFFKDCEYEFR